MSLTLAYVTCRLESRIEWFLESLRNQSGEDEVNLIIVDFHAEDYRNKKETLLKLAAISSRFMFRIVPPKPTVWQGPHRLTKEDWWAKSNALNTAICLCQTEWIAFIDDRCVLGDGWMESVKKAMAGNYAVCGSYEKRSNMQVSDGRIVKLGELIGSDGREQHGQPVPTRDWYGGHGALPLEWCLSVNGFSEDLCDGLGSEDSMFGVCLRNSNFPMCYDSTMRIIEDRTQGQIDGALKRSDYGISPNDKSHAIVSRFQGATTSMNSFDIRQVRDSVLDGNYFPPPYASERDWFTGGLLSEKE